MGYFSNGSEGEGYRENYCDKCKHDKDHSCPIWRAHLQLNYDDCNNKGSVLHMLIPRGVDGENLECVFYEPQTAQLFK